jgi:fucose 4-O-acetylase-like acetyltransferase
VGFFLLSDWARAREVKTMLLVGGAGAICFGLGWWLDSLPVKLYAVYDFWHTSPTFFLMRMGVVMMIILCSYAWCRWGAGQWGFRPLIQMGQASLLVYWIHVEFVYGRFSILTKHGQSIASASLGLLIIFVAMSVLAAARVHTKGHGSEIMEKLRRKLRPWWKVERRLKGTN